MNENDLQHRIDLSDAIWWEDHIGPDEEGHIYGTIGDFCGLMDTYDAKFVWEKLPPEYRDMLIHAIDQSRRESP
jgi:hypothetical protein